MTEPVETMHEHRRIGMILFWSGIPVFIAVLIVSLILVDHEIPLPLWVLYPLVGIAPMMAVIGWVIFSGELSLRWCLLEVVSILFGLYSLFIFFWDSQDGGPQGFARYGDQHGRITCFHKNTYLRDASVREVVHKK